MTISQKYSYPKKVRLLSRGQFREVTKFGCERAGKRLIVQIRIKKYSLTKLGITVSKRFGKAHDRNHFKRIVREAFRLTLPTLPANLYIHIKPKEPKMFLNLSEIQTELHQLIKDFTAALIPS
jgi:ribonuclease P protein component